MALALSLAFSALSFDVVYAGPGRTGRTTQEMRLGRRNTSKQANMQANMQALAQLTAPLAQSGRSIQINTSHTNQLLICLLVTGLLLQSVQAATYDGKLTPIAKKIEQSCGPEEMHYHNATTAQQGADFSCGYALEKPLTNQNVASCASSLMALDSTLNYPQATELCQRVACDAVREDIAIGKGASGSLKSDIKSSFEKILWGGTHKAMDWESQRDIDDLHNQGKVIAFENKATLSRAIEDYDQFKVVQKILDINDELRAKFELRGLDITSGRVWPESNPYHGRTRQGLSLKGDGDLHSPWGTVELTEISYGSLLERLAVRQALLRRLGARFDDVSFYDHEAAKKASFYELRSNDTDFKKEIESEKSYLDQFDSYEDKVDSSQNQFDSLFRKISSKELLDKKGQQVLIFSDHSGAKANYKINELDGHALPEPIPSSCQERDETKLAWKTHTERYELERLEAAKK
jgi:hypothetical protein